MRPLQLIDWPIQSVCMSNWKICKDAADATMPIYAQIAYNCKLFLIYYTYTFEVSYLDSNGPICH